MAYNGFQEFLRNGYGIDLNPQRHFMTEFDEGQRRRLQEAAALRQWEQSFNRATLASYTQGTFPALEDAMLESKQKATNLILLLL